MKWLMTILLVFLVLAMQLEPARCDPDESFGWQEKIISDLLKTSEQHELQYDRISAPSSEELEEGVPRTRELYNNGDEITRYGVNFFKSEQTEDSTRMRFRGGFSDFSSKARAGFEFIVNW